MIVFPQPTESVSQVYQKSFVSYYHHATTELGLQIGATPENGLHPNTTDKCLLPGLYNVDRVLLPHPRLNADRAVKAIAECSPLNKSALYLKSDIRFLRRLEASKSSNCFSRYCRNS